MTWRTSKLGEWPAVAGCPSLGPRTGELNEQPQCRSRDHAPLYLAHTGLSCASMYILILPVSEKSKAKIDFSFF
jgi:hypothetical protein